MHAFLSLFLLPLFVLSLPFSAACCMSGIGLLEKSGVALLWHALVFFVAFTAPAAILACAAHCFFFESCQSIWVLLVYAGAGAIGAALDQEV